MLEKCNNCGFEEKRLTDGKVPLVLDFEDGDRKNHKHENLRMLCFKPFLNKWKPHRSKKRI